jgi:peptide chain release factor 1
MVWPQDVRKKDLRVERIRGSGAGGQKRNKTSSAVRITHLPTGLVGYSEDERSQTQNKKTAFRRLADKLVPLMKQETVRERYAAGHVRIRSYHEPDQRVTDARIPGKRWRYDDVIDGSGLSDIIREVALARQERP